MGIFRALRVSAWLPAFLLAGVLGAQVLQSAHIHADHTVQQDCVQCQLDSGQALLSAPAQFHKVDSLAENNQPAIALVPVSTSYQLAARGPPRRSC